MPRRRKSPGNTKRRVGVTFEQVRLVAQAFPGIEDSTSYGTPALKVRGKLLARVHQSGECFVLRADLLDREILMQSAPRRTTAGQTPRSELRTASKMLTSFRTGMIR
jgi:hypothetical protein